MPNVSRFSKSFSDALPLFYRDIRERFSISTMSFLLATEAESKNSQIILQTGFVGVESFYSILDESPTRERERN